MLGSLSSRAWTWGRVLLAGVVSALAATPPAIAGSLPDGRAYELVSPADKLGNEVMAESTMTRAASHEAAMLPAAVSFAALGGFVDVRGMGIATEYLAQRTGSPGTSGWTTHGITPPQMPLSAYGAVLGLTPGYDGEMSEDLTRGVFRSWSPLTDAPNVAHVENLYLRENLRQAGEGVYRLLTSAPSLLAAPDLSDPLKRPAPPFLADSTDDMEHVLFESRLALTADAHGRYVKLYKTDGARTRLVAASDSCPGGQAVLGPGQCAAAGLGATAQRYVRRALSADGSRVAFIAPVSNGGEVVGNPGIATRLFQLDDQGTTATADDAVIQLNRSEKATPATAQAATFQTASTDGSRVFFLSGEQLTSRSGGGLYMWERQPTDEEQTLTVDASGGSFTLTFHRQVSTGSGQLTSGSKDVTSIAGSFSVGETVTGTGVPAGTTVTDISGSSLTLSANATASGTHVLHASADDTTDPLQFDASAAQVQSALEGLQGIGSGNVEVSGGPGSAGGGSPYVITFAGALAGVNVEQLSADDSGLTGGPATATVDTTRPLQNLTLIVSSASAIGTIGASEDGRRVYLAVDGAQLVAGAPVVRETGIYYWHDTAGGPEGTLAFVGGVASGDLGPVINYSLWSSSPKISRVTRDGRYLLFEVSDGSTLAPGYDQLVCHGKIKLNPNNNGTGGCSEVYVYRADTSTPTTPDLVCASCNPTGASPVDSAWINIRRGASAGNLSTHLSQAITDDGRRVFFSSRDALVPEDTNGKFDAYEYDVPSGTVHLLSSGNDLSDSFFLDASADGHDVYFITRQRLVGWDTDSSYDIYDARVGGGFPDPPAPPRECVGDTCQGQAGAAPAAPTIGSAVFRGLGNRRARLRRRSKSRRRCKRGRVRRRVHGRVRCVRRHRAHRSSRRRGARR